MVRFMVRVRVRVRVRFRFRVRIRVRVRVRIRVRFRVRVRTSGEWLESNDAMLKIESTIALAKVVVVGGLRLSVREG